MTQEQELREARYNEFTWFGASRFTFYIVAGIAVYMGALKIAGSMLIVGAIIGLIRRIYHLVKS